MQCGLHASGRSNRSPLLSFLSLNYDLRYYSDLKFSKELP
jgi:hypothetical protein